MADALAAQAGGADRVELCAGQPEGGTTPSIGMLEQIREHLRIPAFVMVRERGGDFCYDDFEFAAMRRNVALVAGLGFEGVVFGILDPENRVDFERNRQLIEIAREISPGIAITFHRAFDVSSNPFEDYQRICELGFDRLLTSGQAPTAVEGAGLIAELAALNGPTAIMPGSGVRPGNVEQLLALPISNIHSSASSGTNQKVDQGIVAELAQAAHLPQ